MNFNLRHFKFEVLTMHISSDANLGKSVSGNQV